MSSLNMPNRRDRNLSCSGLGGWLAKGLYERFSVAFRHYINSIGSFESTARSLRLITVIPPVFLPIGTFQVKACRKSFSDQSAGCEARTSAVKWGLCVLWVGLRSWWRRGRGHVGGPGHSWFLQRPFQCPVHTDLHLLKVSTRESGANLYAGCSNESFLGCTVEDSLRPKYSSTVLRPCQYRLRRSPPRFGTTCLPAG